MTVKVDCQLEWLGCQPGVSVWVGKAHFLMCPGGSQRYKYGSTCSPLFLPLCCWFPALLFCCHERSSFVPPCPSTLRFLTWRQFTIYYIPGNCNSKLNSPPLNCECWISCPINRKAHEYIYQSINVLSTLIDQFIYEDRAYRLMFSVSIISLSLSSFCKWPL